MAISKKNPFFFNNFAIFPQGTFFIDFCWFYWFFLSKHCVRKRKFFFVTNLQFSIGENFSKRALSASTFCTPLASDDSPLIKKCKIEKFFWNWERVYINTQYHPPFQFLCLSERQDRDNVKNKYQKIKSQKKSVWL